ncbi:flippase Wzx domain protein [Streptococcus pneumoniae 2070335]|nr:flippase Wzx domain protein [Streptococcus pneumoniae 2070335]
MTVSYLIYATVFVNSFQIVAYIQVLHVLSYATDVSWFFMVLKSFVLRLLGIHLLSY